MNLETVSVKDIINKQPWPIVEGEVMHEHHRTYVEKVARFKEMIKNGAKFPPIVLNKDSTIFDGQSRYEAYRQLGWEAVTCVRKYD